MNESLIYDWNRYAPAPRDGVVMLDDETLRDGLQSPSCRAPTIDQKIRILHLRIGVDTAERPKARSWPCASRRVERTGTRDLRRSSFQAGYFVAGGSPGRTYDVSPDGQRFLMIKPGGADQAAAPPQIVVVKNWFEELKRLVPAN